MRIKINTKIGLSDLNTSLCWVSGANKYIHNACASIHLQLSYIHMWSVCIQYVPECLTYRCPVEYDLSCWWSEPVQVSHTHVVHLTVFYTMSRNVFFFSFLSFSLVSAQHLKWSKWKKKQRQLSITPILTR